MDPHQDVEGLLVLPAHNPFLGDQDSREEGPVHLLAKLRAGCEVGLVAVLGPGDCPFHNPFDLSQACLGLGQGTLRGLHVSGDALLLDLQQIERYGSGVVGVQQLGPFVVEGAETLSLPLLFFTSVGLALGQLVDHGGGGLPKSFGGELHQAVVILDLFFHQGQRPVLEHAGRPLLMPPHAEVVQVVAAGLGPAVGDAQL